MDGAPACPNGYHPLDPAVQRDPWDLLRELRDTCPVVSVECGDEEVVVVTRYDDFAAVARDYRGFGNIGHHPSRLAASTPLSSRNLSSLDPPRHTTVRRLYLVALRPGAIDDAFPEIERFVRTHTTEVVRQLRDGAIVDFVARWAVPIPARSIATVLGLPAHDSDRIHDWVESQFSDTAIAAREQADSMQELFERNRDFDEYLRREIARRRAGPTDDAISRMLAVAEHDGVALSDDEVRFFVRDILVAGNETTTSLMSNLLYRLLSEPGAWDALRRDPALVESAVEESLRIDTPLTQFAKIARHEGTVGIAEVSPGDVLSLSMQSANRDERHFGPDAGEFRVDRFADRHPDHVGFGIGIHLCVGAYLARRTARAALHTLLDSGVPLELAPGYEYEKVAFYEFRRPRRLDVRARTSTRRDAHEREDP